MKCQKCGVNDANINYTRVINGKRGELHLCSECAQKMNINLNIGFDSLFSDFFDDFSMASQFALPGFTSFDGIERDLNRFIGNSLFSGVPFFANDYLLETADKDLDEALDSIQKKHILIP